MAKVYVCPYWKWGEKLCVHCEGGRIRFPDTRAKVDFVSRYCANLPGWERCSIAKTWSEYYERM